MSVRVCVLLHCVSARPVLPVLEKRLEPSPRASGAHPATRRSPLCSVYCSRRVTVLVFPTPERKLYWFDLCLDEARRHRPQNRFCEEHHNWPFSFVWGVGSKFSPGVTYVAWRAVFLAPTLGLGREPPSKCISLLFPYCCVRYSGMRSAARSKPSITSWRGASASCTCSSIPIGRLGLIRKGARRGSENRRQPMEVLPCNDRCRSPPASRYPLPSRVAHCAAPTALASDARLGRLVSNEVN